MLLLRKTALLICKGSGPVTRVSSEPKLVKLLLLTDEIPLKYAMLLCMVDHYFHTQLRVTVLILVVLYKSPSFNLTLIV